MKKIYLVVLVLFIFFVGVFVRFYELGNVPNSLNWDEVSWGYNAYSIEKTGKDEYGVSYPMSFRAFGDFKQPVYVYLTSISTKYFDLTPFAVRLPSAILGSFSIIFIFFLVRELFFNNKYRDVLAIASMAFFALSPWSIQFSRVAYEANVALFFVIVGFFAFFHGIRRKNLLILLVSTFFLAVSAYSYHSEKVVTPILFLGLLTISYKYFLSKKIIAVIIGIFFILCCSFWLLDFNTTQRGRSVLFFSDTTKALGRSVEVIQFEKENNYPLASIVHNRRIIYVRKFVSNYLSHFNPKYLFLTGDQEQHHAPNVGILYLFSLPFVLIGVICLLKNGFSQAWYIFVWMLIAPIASSLAMDAPNASRNLIMAPVFDILAGYGFIVAILYLHKNRILYYVGAFATIFIIANILFFLHQYFIHTNLENGKYWQYGYEDAILESQKLDSGKNTIVFANDIEQGYAFYLFYTKFDPKTYQLISKKQKGYDCREIYRIKFGDCKYILKKGDMLITSIKPEKEDFVTINNIHYLDGLNAVGIYERK